MNRPISIDSVLAAADGSAPESLARAFARNVERYAGNEAIKPPDGPAISYADLGRRVREALAVFGHLRLTAGDRIAICLPNSPEWAVMTCAAALAGLCVVPINLRYREDELLHALSGSGAKVLFAVTQFLSNSVLDRLRALAGGSFGGAKERGPIAALPRLEHLVFCDDADVPGSASYAGLARACSPVQTSFHELADTRSGEDPMWLFWTSGTTSRPKAALLPQSTIEIVWQWTTLAGYRPDDRVLTSRPLFYIAGHFWSMLGPLVQGACSVIASRFSAEEMVQLCASERITILSGNPVMFKRLIQSDAFDAGAFRRVRLGYFGGSALPLDEMRKIRDAIGFESLIQTYGMTELGGFIMSTLPTDSLETACASCGAVFTDIELKLVSPDTGRPVAQGETGLLLTRGQKLIRYENLPEEERSRLYDAQGWYRTGDLMRQLPDGRYQLVGRLKDLIKVGGENVTAAEIEDTLMQHPAVSLVAVIGRKDADKGEVPVAFVEFKPGAALSVAELKAWSKAHMAPYKVPADIYEMQAQEWPMTSTGKIAKHTLMAHTAGLA